MNIERALKVDGWMSEPSLMYLATVATRSLRIVEVGSWKGRSTCALAANTKGLVFAVDTWLGSPEQGDNFDPVQVELEFHSNIQGLPVCPFKGDSLVIADRFLKADVKFDLVFVDAKHAYESVKPDLEAWKQLVMPGGIMCGHDYHECWPGVRQAVQETFEHFEVVPDTTIWTTYL